MHSENTSNYIFSMFEAFCEDIKLDKRNFDEQYGKSFYEASFHRVTLIQENYSKHATFSVFRANHVLIEAWHLKL